MAIATGQFTIIDQNDITVSTTAPSSPVTDQMWLDTSKTPPLLMRYNGSAWLPLGARTFTTTPTTPYTVGDLWTQGTTGDLMKCKVTRLSGSYVATDWEKAVKYTDDTAVNNLKIGSKNLIFASKSKITTTSYLIRQYVLSENFIPGEEYTFVIKGAVPTGQKLGIWMNNGGSNVGYATTVYSQGVTYCTFKAVTPTTGYENKLNLYNYPSNTTSATVDWVALYKGSKPTDWTPAPEDVDQEIADLNSSLSSLQTDVDNFSSDGYITLSEANSLKVQLIQVKNESTDLVSVAGTLGITTEKTNYSTSLTTLETEINKWIGKTYPLTITSTDRANITNKFKDVQAKKTILINKITSVQRAKAEEYAKIQVDNIAVGGKNLLLNSTFNDGFTNWGTTSLATVISPESDKPNSSILHFNYTGNTQNNPAFNSKRVLVKADGTEKFTVSLDVYADDITLISSLVISIRLYSAQIGGSGVAFGTVSTTDLRVGGMQNGKWFRYSKVIDIPVNDTNKWLTFGYYTSSGDANYKIRELKWEVGNKATDWTTAPEDIDKEIEETNASLSTLQGNVDKYANDGYISLSEANSLKVQLNQVKTESTDLIHVASALGITTEQTNYSTSLTTLETEINKWINQTSYPKTIASTDRTNINTKFQDVQDKKSILINKIASVREQNAIDYTKYNTGNLVQNTSVENSVSRWNRSTLPSIEQKDFYGVTIPVQKAYTNGNFEVSSEVFEVDPSKAYEVTLWFMSDGNAGKIYFGITSYPSDSFTPVNVDMLRETDGVINTTNNPYFWSGDLPSNNVWYKKTAYILPAGYREIDAIGIGTAVLNNARMLPDTKRIKIRYLNYYNNGTYTTVWVAHPKVVEVSPDQIRNMSQSLKKEVAYNGVTIDAANGLVITRSDGVVKTTANATEGFKIEKNGMKQFFVDENGDAQFAGNIQSATGTFAGKVEAGGLVYAGSPVPELRPDNPSYIANRKFIYQGTVQITIDTTLSIAQVSVYFPSDIAFDYFAGTYLPSILATSSYYDVLVGAYQFYVQNQSTGAYSWIGTNDMTAVMYNLKAIKFYAVPRQYGGKFNANANINIYYAVMGAWH